METAQEMCLETDSLKVVIAFNKGIGVPWQLRARWKNCLSFCQGISGSCVHIGLVYPTID